MSNDSPSSRQNAPREHYESRLRELDEQLAAMEASARALSLQRGIVFFVGIGVLFAIFNERIGEAFGYSLLAVD